MFKHVQRDKQGPITGPKGTDLKAKLLQLGISPPVPAHGDAYPLP